MNMILEPEFFLDFDGSIKTGVIEINDDRIVAMGAASNKNAPKISLKNQVIMPGFVNAHSHVFHRALRGVVERSSEKKADNFWSWREKMYRCANHITKDDLLVLALFTYLEMIEAGFTHVGEFHYLHHDQNGQPFSDALAMSRTLIDSATQAGINLCLLQCAYARHSFHHELRAEQRRFAFNNVDEYLAFLKSSCELATDRVSVGAAIHSVRAVPETWFVKIHQFTKMINSPLHIHASEQRAEVDACVEAHGVSPIALLAKHDLLTPATTLVHATHLIRNDIEILSLHKPLVCICPSTEKNLGDGIIPLKSLQQNHIEICIGTDQHVRFDPFCEARSLEETERLRLFRRGILNENQGYLFKPLIKYLSQTGMQSLYPAGAHNTLIQKKANLVAIELPEEYGWHGPEIAMDAIMLSYNPSKITTVITNGQFVLQEKLLVNSDKKYLANELKKFFKRVF